MDKTLYDLMDWAGIEEIVYSEAANPHRMLGAHMTPEGMLVQAFIPTARDITVKLSATGKQYQMETGGRDWLFCGADSAQDSERIIPSLCFMIMVR
ncbi:MAG: GlgB N-terminal domain-containing protein [Clostridium fessum]